MLSYKQIIPSYQHLWVKTNVTNNGWRGNHVELDPHRCRLSPRTNTRRTVFWITSILPLAENRRRVSSFFASDLGWVLLREFFSKLALTQLACSSKSADIRNSTLMFLIIPPVAVMVRFRIGLALANDLNLLVKSTFAIDLGRASHHKSHGHSRTSAWPRRQPINQQRIVAAFQQCWSAGRFCQWEWTP